MTNQEIIDTTVSLLQQNPQWQKQYKDYATEINNHIENYKANSKSFSIKFPLSAYTSITKLKDNTSKYDIRFLGQSIGRVEVNSKGVFFVIDKDSKGYDDLRVKQGLFQLPIITNDNKNTIRLNWNDPKMRKVRSILKNTDLSVSTKSEEHKCENLLLKEFSKSKSVEKSLCNIQPVKFAGKFIQLTTPLSASDHNNIKHSGKNGGGIDILARVRHKDNKVHLCVIELKDENKQNEPMSVVIQQALCYSTFLALLLQSESGKEWAKLFGFSRNVEPKIDVVGLMPNDSVETIPSEEYKVGDYTLSTHTLYFDKTALTSKEKFVFSGNYTDIIKSI